MNALDWEESVIHRAIRMAKRYGDPNLQKSLEKLLKGKNVTQKIIILRKRKRKRTKKGKYRGYVRKFKKQFS